MTSDIDRDRLEGALGALGHPFELFPCDPALADTAQFCAAYGFDLDEKWRQLPDLRLLHLDREV